MISNTHLLARIVQKDRRLPSAAADDSSRFTKNLKGEHAWFGQSLRTCRVCWSCLHAMGFSACSQSSSAVVT